MIKIKQNSITFKDGVPEVIINGEIIKGLVDVQCHWHTNGRYIGTDDVKVIYYDKDKDGIPYEKTFTSSRVK